MTWAGRWCATARPSARAPPTCPSTARAPRPSTTTASRLCTRSCASLLAEQGHAASRRARSRPSPRSSRLASRPSCRPRGCATSPRSARRSATTTEDDGTMPPRRPGVQRLEAVRGELADGRARSAEVPSTGAPRGGSRRPARRTWPTSWPRGRSVVESYSGDEQVVRIRDKEIVNVLTRESLSGNKIPRVALPRYQDHGELVSLPASREPPRLLPLHGGRLPVQARGRGPGAHVRRGGRPVPHQPPLQAALRGTAGDAPVHGVRLGDPLRPRPRPAPGRLRQGRHVRRLHRDARRHEGALRRVRPRVPDDDRSR